MGSSQKNINKWRIYHYSTVMHSIILPEAYPEFTVHINFEHDHLEVLKLGFCMTCHFSFMHVLQTGQL